MRVVGFAIIRMRKRICEEPVLNDNGAKKNTTIPYCCNVKIEYILTIVSSNI